MTTPSDGSRPDSGSALPPHLDPRGQGRASVPRVTDAYRDAARGPAPRPGGPGGPGGPRPPAYPPPPRRTGGRRWGRALSWVALTMSVLILGTAGVGYVLVRHYEGNISKIDVFGNRKGSPAKAPNHAMNVLLVGSDSRAGANANQGGGGAGVAAGQRSDTIILAHLYGRSNKALFVSFPRDSYVEIPAFTDAKGVTHRSRHDKINSAITTGGPKLLIATIEKLTDIRIDHYVQVDFVGFRTMVDKLGGVDICLKKDVNDPKSHLRLSAGRHHVNGLTALAFARDRHSFAGQDIDRIKNQQQLIGSMIHKVLSANTLLNPLKLNGFLNAATSSLQVDENLGFGDMKNIALRVRGFSSGNVLFVTVPIANANARINGASVVELDDAAGAAMFDSLRRDHAPGTVPKPAAGAAALTVPPSSIRVRLYNGSGIAGLARKAFNDLSAVGFVTTGTPTNRGAAATNTTVLYGPTRAESAKTLAAAIPGAVLQEDPSLQRTLEVVVGSSYSGAKRVTVTAPANTPSATASPAPKLRSAQDDICA